VSIDWSVTGNIGSTICGILALPALVFAALTIFDRKIPLKSHVRDKYFLSTVAGSAILAGAIITLMVSESNHGQHPAAPPSQASPVPDVVSHPAPSPPLSPVPPHPINMPKVVPPQIQGGGGGIPQQQDTDRGGQPSPCGTTTTDILSIPFYVSVSVNRTPVANNSTSQMVMDSIRRRIAFQHLYETDHKDCAKLQIITEVNFTSTRILGDVHYNINIVTNFKYDNSNHYVSSAKTYSIQEYKTIESPAFWDRCAISLTLADNFQAAKLMGVFTSAAWKSFREMGSEGNLESRCEAG